MAESVGLSFLYPGAPIACIFSILALLTLVPGFWRTGVWNLLAIVGWLVIGDLVILIGMIGWHGNTHNAPILADLLVGLQHIQLFGDYASMACFSKFVWQRSRHLSARQILDNRRRNNLIDGFISVVLPLLWLPTFLFSCAGRYLIMEDYGPQRVSWVDWTTFFIAMLPLCLSALAMGTFYALTLRNYSQRKRRALESNLTEMSSSLHTRKLMWFSLTSLLLTGFMIGWSVGKYLQYSPVSTWDYPNTPAQNIAYLQTVRYVDRFFLGTEEATGVVEIMTSNCISTIFLGFYMFAWFGLGAEARKSYWGAFMSFVHLFGILSAVRHTVTTKLIESSSNGLPIACVIAPFPLPSEPEKSHLPSSSVSKVEVGCRQKPLSLTTPSLPTNLMRSTKAGANPSENISTHRPPYRKPPLPPVSTANFVRQGTVRNVVPTRPPAPPYVP